MSRFVRVVQIVPTSANDAGRAEALRARAATLPPAVTAGIVPTGAGLQVTLTTRYRPLPGSHRRAVRMLHESLNGLLSC